MLIFICLSHKMCHRAHNLHRSSGSQSVRLSGTNLSKALNLHLSLIGLSQVSLSSVSGQSQVSLCAYFVRQTEPKILRLIEYVKTV